MLRLSAGVTLQCVACAGCGDVLAEGMCSGNTAVLVLRRYLPPERAARERLFHKDHLGTCPSYCIWLIPGDSKLPVQTWAASGGTGACRSCSHLRGQTQPGPCPTAGDLSRPAWGVISMGAAASLVSHSHGSFPRVG